MRRVHTEAVQANRMIATELNAVNRELHVVADWMKPDDWLRRGAPGTNLPAFIFWHVPRIIDSTVHMGLRGVPELIDTQPWAEKPWARQDAGVGYSTDEADALAQQVVLAEVLEYADAVRAQVSQWLRSITDEELDAPNVMIDRAKDHPAYYRPAVRESIEDLAGLPVWLLLSITCFAHCWAHMEEIRLLTGVARAARG